MAQNLAVIRLRTPVRVQQIKARLPIRVLVIFQRGLFARIRLSMYFLHI